MKNIARMMLLVMLLLLVVPTTFAQDGCHGLSADDCALYADSLELDGVTSGAFGFVMNLGVTGDEPMEISATIAGSFSEYEDGTFDLSVDFEASADGEEDIAGGLRIVDEVAYIGAMGEWRYASLERLSEAAGMDISMLFAEDDMAEMDMAMEMIPDFFLKYYSVERGDDMDGMAVFNSSYDIAGLFTDPELGPSLMGLVAMSGYEGLGDMSAMSDEEMAQMSQMVGMMLGMMVSDPVLTYRVAVDPATGWFSAADLDFGMTVNLAAMMGGDSAPIGINAHLEIALVDLNGEFVYEVPEGAVEATDEELQELMGELTGALGGF